MALVACKECGKDISSEAKTCPNCGIKLKVVGSWINETAGNVITIFIIIIVVAIFLLK